MTAVPISQCRFRPVRRRCLAVLALLLALIGCNAPADSAPPIKIGLIAPLSGELAPSGEAIQRGMLLAMEEINAAGGVLERPLELVTRDVSNNPEAGVAALHELVEQEQIVAVFGGIFSPVMLAQLESLHQLQIPLINPWGSVSSITRNAYRPNYAFRVSVSDEYADEFLVRYALEVVGVERPGIIADTTAWGDSNVSGLAHWLAEFGVKPAGIVRFDQGDTNMTSQLQRLRDAGADSLLMIANAPEGAAIVRGLGVLNWRPPVISHWGISGGMFVQNAGIDNAEGVLTLQTFSFYDQSSPNVLALLEAYHKRFGTRSVAEIPAPVGVAHGYDGVHLLALALSEAGNTSGPALRDALERIGPYDGLVKRYNPAFTAERHDALLADDYVMAIWRDGKLIPAPQPQLEK